MTLKQIWDLVPHDTRGLVLGLVPLVASALFVLLIAAWGSAAVVDVARASLLFGGVYAGLGVALYRRRTNAAE